AAVKQQWQADKKGDVVIERVRWEFAEPQKSAQAAPGDLRDARIRQGLILAMNRQEMSQALQGEYWGVADSWVYIGAANYAQYKDAITVYPFDTRKATAMFADAGWTPGSDGILQKNGARFTLQIRPEPSREKQAAVLQQNWKAVGIDGQIEVLSNELLRDSEARASFTGISVNANPMGGVSAVRRFAGDQIPTPANKFAGTNRGQYVNPAWDDLGNRI